MTGLLCSIQPTEPSVLKQILSSTLCTFRPLGAASVFNVSRAFSTIFLIAGLYWRRRLMFTYTLIPLGRSEMKVSHEPWPFKKKYDTRKPKACVKMGREWRRKVMVCVCFSCREATNLSYCLQVGFQCSLSMCAGAVKLEMIPF